ncbi:hypothetical protein BD779DRAFT_1629219 [Infundibulicybe gibba]|nr:hypothetical protein BD779DRAFT_1629219 [Infundibulicybe gibba]
MFSHPGSSPHRMKVEPTDDPEPSDLKTSSQQALNSPTEPSEPVENTSSAAPATPQTGKRKAEVQAGSQEKRRKNSPEGFMEHPRFWLPDGNIQVQIGPIRFNLHRSRLAASSLWFKRHFEERDTREIENGFDMENEPEPVELDATGVDITDFERLLIAMDDIVDYYHSPPPFATIASILRAASILEFPKFQSYARGALEALFPDSLEDVGAKTIPHAAEVLILARAWGLPRVLKRAFYELARFPPGAAASSALSLLSPADIILVAQAQKHLATAWISAYKPPDCALCGHSSKVSAAIKFSDISWFMSLSVKYQFDPILGFAMLPQEYKRQVPSCSVCAEVREKVWRTRASRIWNTDLGVWFKLGMHSNN